MLLGILINAEYYDRHNVEIVKVLKKLRKGEEEIAPRHTESQEKTHHEQLEFIAHEEVEKVESAPGTPQELWGINQVLGEGSVFTVSNVIGIELVS